MNDVNVNSADMAAKRSAGSAASSQIKPRQTVSDSSASSAKADNARIDQLARQRQLAQISQKEDAAQRQEEQKQVREAVTKLNDYVQSVQRNLQFDLDNDSGKTVITVVDKQTSEVIRQIPDDVALRLAQDLQQDEPLSLFNAKV